MNHEVVRHHGTTLLYIGTRSYQRRFMVLGWHNIDGPFVRPFKMFEITYYPRTGQYQKGRHFRLPQNRRRSGPFMEFKWARHNWVELLVGWRHRGRR